MTSFVQRSILTAALLFPTVAGAQDSTTAAPGSWNPSATFGLNLAQSTFSSNWAGGDQGAIVWVLNSDLRAERQLTPVFHLSNVLQVAYGQTAKQVEDPGRPGELVWDRPGKTTDQIALESTGRLTLHAWVDPYVALRAESQFSDRSSPLGDIPFNPVKLKESAGVARVLEKSEDREIVTRLGFGLRQTFGQSFVDPITRAKERFVSNDGGIEWQTSANRPLLGGKVIYKGSLLFFQPIFYSKSSALEDFDDAAIAAFPERESVADFWKATDVNFQNAFTAAITEHLGVDLVVQLVYDKFDASANLDDALPLDVQIAEVDKNVRKAGQLKQTLSMALTYRLL